jgi:hypothetical protein
VYGPSSDQFLAHYPEPKGKILALAGKLGLKLFYPTCSINKAFFTCKSGVRIHSDIAHQDVVIHTINVFSLLGTGGGYGVELFTSGYVHKGNWVQNWMNVLFHLKLKKDIITLGAL